MNASALSGETMPGMASLRRGFRPTLVGDGPPTIDDLLTMVARGDGPAFEALYDEMANSVFGVIRRVLRDHAQSEEVTQEVLVEVWRNATRFDPERGSATTWILTMAHRRAIDRVRSSQASQDRDQRVAARDHVPDYDQVSEQVEARLEQEQVRRCLDQLTDLQRESITLAYYGGHTYREVAELLDQPLGTVKTRLRDGLIRLRDCLGVQP
jgi:RNA polymerase sigma-70 factor (ECF subfamily)